MGPFPHDAPPPAITPENPMGTDGYAFVEFAHPEPLQLHRLFRLMGFAKVARHRSKAITVLSPEPDAAKAEGYFECALAIARKQQARSWELRAAMSMARLWRDQGKQRQAREILAPVYGWFTEGFDTLDLREARALLDELSP